MFNILLEWQSAVALSPLAKLWNGPFPAAEYINLSVLQNLQIKHRGRRLENENVNLTGKKRLSFLCFEERAGDLHQFLLALFVTFIIWLLSNKPKQAARFERRICSAVKHLVNSSRLHLTIIVSGSLFEWKKEDGDRERRDWAWILVAEICLKSWLHHRTQPLV